MFHGNLQQFAKLFKTLLAFALAFSLAAGFVPLAGLATTFSGLGDSLAFAADDSDDEDEEGRKLAEDEKAAARVADLIASLPAAQKATAADRKAADEARVALDALTKDQKALVPDKDKTKLDDVIAAVAAAEEEAERARQEQERQQEQEQREKEQREKEQQEQQQKDSGKSDVSQGSSGGGKRRTVDEDPNQVNDIQLYATATNSDGNWVKPVLDDKADVDGLRWLKSGIKEKGGKLKLLACVEWGDGRTFWQYDEDWRTVDLRYESSDTSVATVSSSGIVTATGDGKAVFTVTEQKGGKKARLGIRVAGQSGAYVTEVFICDEKGHQYEDERIAFQDTANKLNLYVREVFSDGTKASNAPKASDYKPSALTPITWSVGDAEIGSVNAETGVFIPAALGSVKVYATASGGDPDVKEGKVRGFVWVVIDSGDYGVGGDMPSDSLTVNVIYDAYDQKNADGTYKYIVQSQRYSIAELKAIETVRCTYTLTRSNGAYVTASGIGIHLLTLVERAGIDISQVKSFTFTALDGVNPGKMTYEFLFGERKYWPNYEFGGSRTGGRSVFPMLAWASDWRDSKSGADDSSEDYDNLGGGTCLRLLFGSSTDSDNKTDHSLKYISEMTVRIDGAPDVTSGEGEDGAGDGAEAGGTVAPGDSGQGAGSGKDDASAAQGGKPGEQVGSPDAQVGPVPAGSTKARQTDAAQSTQASDAAASEAPERQQQQQEEGAPVEGAQAAPSQRWHAYQMLNPDDESNLQIDDLKDNPLAPWAAAAVLCALLAGAVGSGLNFRRQLGIAGAGPRMAYAVEGR